ncbi:hypothetical protein [Desulfopila sp. IMCC35008]|uniref:hypothetical protein n=1 Tax=Desulfopila sp. IMCC35008 TaxID=2653858 RepID=UPI0013D82C79|nr:hypothetical protein [Desulfopila sp. IMCC35008]
MAGYTLLQRNLVTRAAQFPDCFDDPVVPEYTAVEADIRMGQQRQQRFSSGFYCPIVRHFYEIYKYGSTRQHIP